MKQAVLLTAGKSSRFWPLAGSGHKSELTLLGHSLLNRTIRALITQGISNIIIIHAEHHRLSVDNFNSSKITFVPLDKPNGMGYALLKAKGQLQDHFIVIHPYHFDAVNHLSEMMRERKKTDGTLLLTLPKKEKSGGYAMVKRDKVVSVEESKYTKGKNKYYIQGMYLLSKRYIAILEKEKLHHYSFETALNSYVKKEKVSYKIIKQSLLSIKYPWDLFAVKNYLFSNMSSSIHQSAIIHPTALLEGEILVEEGAQIGSYAVVKGPAYIGKHAFIGDHTLVRGGSVIENRSVVGAFTEVKNTILMERSYAQGYVSDSIIGKSVKIAHGFITGNRRLDREKISSKIMGRKVNTDLTSFGTVVGDNVAFGIAVHTMPGVMIGEDAVVGPATTVFKNVPSGVTHYKKQKLVNEENNK